MLSRRLTEGFHYLPNVVKRCSSTIKIATGLRDTNETELIDSADVFLRRAYLYADYL